MSISSVQFGVLLPAQAQALGRRWPRTAAEANALVRQMNETERLAREQRAGERRQRDAELDELVRQAKAEPRRAPTRRRPALNVAEIYRQRNTPAGVRSAQLGATA